MILLDIENNLENINDQSWYAPVANCVKDLMERYPDMEIRTRDRIFEYENNCQVNYQINSTSVRSIVFLKDEAWTLFVLKWS